MSVTEFMVFSKKGGVMIGGLGKPQLNRIFAAMQDIDESENEDDSDDDATELVFSEFMEVMVCVACFHDPSPFVPLPQRFDTYISKNMVPALTTAGVGGIIGGEFG